MREDCGQYHCKGCPHRKILYFKAWSSLRRFLLRCHRTRGRAGSERRDPPGMQRPRDKIENGRLRVFSFSGVYYVLRRERADDDERWGAAHLLVRWFCGTALFGRYCMWALAANSQWRASGWRGSGVSARERYRYRYTAGKCVKSSGASAGVNAALRLRRRAGAGRRGRHAHCRSHTPRWRPVRPMGLAGRG